MQTLRLQYFPNLYIGKKKKKERLVKEFFWIPILTAKPIFFTKNDGSSKPTDFTIKAFLRKKVIMVIKISTMCQPKLV